MIIIVLFMRGTVITRGQSNWRSFSSFRPSRLGTGFLIWKLAVTSGIQSGCILRETHPSVCVQDTKCVSDKNCRCIFIRGHIVKVAFVSFWSAIHDTFNYSWYINFFLFLGFLKVIVLSLVELAIEARPV